MSLQGPDAGTPESHIFNRTDIAVDIDKLVDLKGSVRENSHRAEKIGYGIFCCQCDGPQNHWPGDDRDERPQRSRMAGLGTAKT